MKKRILSVVLVLSMMVSFMPIIASAYTGIKYGDYLYYKVDGKEVTITGCDESAVSVSIPSTIVDLPVTKISEWAISNCKSLTSITIPNSMTNIGYNAFRECSSLTSITIPNSVMNIGNVEYGAFSGCEKLTEINVDSENQYYKSIDGVLFSKDGTKLIDYPAGKESTSYEIPYGVTTICGFAFDRCKNLNYITIPNSMNSIGYSTFSNCSNLKSINIPDSIIEIGGFAFDGCSNLTNITIPNSVTSIGDAVFFECSNLKNITLPNSITKFGNNVFSGCSSLTSITLPYGVTYFLDNDVQPSGMFWGCSSLISVTIPNSITYIGESSFSGCTNLKDVYYTGTEAEWDKIDINNVGNDDLLNATIHYNSTTPSTIYSADKVSTQITSGKLKITLNVDDNISNATVYVAFRNNGKIVDVKKATLSNLKAEVSLSNKTYTDMNIYIWNSRQQPYTYVKNIKK